MDGSVEIWLRTGHGRRSGLIPAHICIGSPHLVSCCRVFAVVLGWAAEHEHGGLSDCVAGGYSRPAALACPGRKHNTQQTTGNRQRATGKETEVGSRRPAGGHEEGALGRDLGGIWTESLLRLGQRGGIDGNGRTRFYRRARHCAGTPVALGAACVSEGGREEGTRGECARWGSSPARQIWR